MSLLHEKVLPQPVIFGHSLGGMVGMWVASHNPELVRALILGDNLIIPRRLDHPMYVALFSGLRDLARKGGSVEQIAAGIGKIKLQVEGNGAAIAIKELPGNDEAYLLSWARCVAEVDPDASRLRSHHGPGRGAGKLSGEVGGVDRSSPLDQDL